MAWDFAEKQRIARAAMATGMGFNPEQYARPFPGSAPNTTNINVAPPEKEKNMAPLLTAALVGVLGAGAAAGVGALWGARPVSTAQPAEMKPQPQYEYQYRVNGGEWLPIRETK